MAGAGLRISVDDRVGVVTIDRPDVLNALNTALLEELLATLTDLGGDGGIAAIIMTGEGDRSFIAGADIKEFLKFTSGANARQVRTIVEEVENQVKESGGPAPIRIEGLDDARWVLMDYGDFVVHVFLQEVREFYDLERLWADAPVWNWLDDERVATGS